MRKPLLLALSLVGLFDAAYLWWVYTSPTQPMACLGNGCDVVRASSYAHLWGLPLPVYGAVMYALLALLIFAQALASPRVEAEIRYALAGVSGAGFLFSLYLTGIEAFVLHAWCTWCVISALVVTFIFGLAMLEMHRPAAPSDPAAALATVRGHFAVFVVALVLGVPGFFFLSRRAELTAIPPGRPPAEVLSERLVRPDSHVSGNAQAAVTVVEFGDFQCSHCVVAEQAAREIREKYGNRIRFVFRHFPLERLHPQAEKAAEASECAARQGRFWEAVEKFYLGQNDLSEKALERYAAELGLDQARFHQCLASGSMAARVRRDIEDARALRVSKTPTFFVGQQIIEGALTVAEFAQRLEQEFARHGAAATGSSARPGSVPEAYAPPAAPPITGGKPTGDPGASAGPLLANRATGFFSQFQKSTTACGEDEAGQQPALIQTPKARQFFEGESKALFVDVRTVNDFKSKRIRGAINVPAEEIERGWSRLPRDRNIVLYESGQSPGDACASSRAAGRVLLAHGFAPEQVKVYQDGLAGWEKAGLPVEH